MGGRKCRINITLALITLFVPCFFFDAFAISAQTLEENWKLGITPDIRLSYNRANNTGDLKNSGGDELGYFSYIYNIPLKIIYKSRHQFFIKITSEGPSHYAAPLNEITTAVEGSRVKKGGSDSILYPWISEVWLKFYPTLSNSIQIGQSPYVIGNGYALGGQYNNYGATYSYEDIVRLRYSILDVENVNSEIRKDTHSKWLGRSADSDAYMVAADLKLRPVNNKTAIVTLQPYIGLLYDRTAFEKRKQHGYFANSNTSFRAKRDEIYTYGLSAVVDSPYFTFELEAAKNAGETKGEDNQNWGDIKHKGYLIHTAVNGHFGMFTPRAKLVIASGNEVSTDDYQKYNAGSLKRTENNAFTVFSPLNTNLVDSFAHIAPVPVVAMAGGYTMNYGIRRPGAFNDPHVWENISAYNIGLNITPSETSFIMIDYWSLKAMNAGIGLDANNNIRYLSKDLGNEIDVYATYSITKGVTFGVHGGYFMPGEYYKTVRSDPASNWGAAMSQTVRADGSSDSASQMEFFVAYKF
ncbi:MAG: hypothetical protein HY096_03820 [Nitrospinae bacterium]|nr:hypothetical protein [Nitrospinota bacterium]